MTQMYGEQRLAMEKESSTGDFFVTAEAAKVAISKLTTMGIHPHFSGYLATVSTAAEEKREDNLKVNFQQFYSDYLLVSGAPTDRPYLQPFSQNAKGVPQLFNKNVAGSYAPSSLRDVAPIRAVVEFRGGRQHVTQSLKTAHEELALKALTGSQRIPVHSLATFLFRDHRIPLISKGNAIESALHMFCVIFGYDLTQQPSRERFEKLYEFDSATFDSVTYAES